MQEAEYIFGVIMNCGFIFLNRYHFRTIGGLVFVWYDNSIIKKLQLAKKLYSKLGNSTLNKMCL